MRLLMMLMLQAPPPISFDLAAMPHEAPSCAAGGGADILVCARRPPPQSPRLPDRAEGDALPAAEVKLFGQVRGSLHGDQTNVGGFTSNRAMMTVAVPF